MDNIEENITTRKRDNETTREYFNRVRSELHNNPSVLSVYLHRGDSEWILRIKLDKHSPRIEEDRQLIEANYTVAIEVSEIDELIELSAATPLELTIKR